MKTATLTVTIRKDFPDEEKGKNIKQWAEDFFLHLCNNCGDDVEIGQQGLQVIFYE